MHAFARPLRFPVIEPSYGSVRAAAREAPVTVHPAGEPLLQVEGHTTRFNVRSGLPGLVRGRVHAVENISFQLRQGETLALVGESGFGESTGGRSILQPVEPTSSTVPFGGQDIRAMRKDEWQRVCRKIQMVFQDPFADLNPPESVGAAIAESMIVHGMASRRDPPEQTAALLKGVGLTPDMARRCPREFSGGQRQRVAIARALSPALVVADEAFSALDVRVKAQVLNLKLDLQEELGLANLFISHGRAVAGCNSHGVAAMHLGEIVETAPRAALFASPRHPYTRRLLSAEELPNPIRPTGWHGPPSQLREVAPGHFVREML